MQLNPEDLSKNKAPNEPEGSLNEKDFEDDMSGNDPDVSGSELDNQQKNAKVQLHNYLNKDLHF